MPQSNKKAAGSLPLKLAVLGVCLAVLGIISNLVLGWPNIRHYFKAPGPVYGVLSNQPLKYVLKTSNVTEKLEDYKFYILKPALMAPITKGDYEGDENYKWRVTEMYISFLENILSRNEQLEYHIDKDEKKIFIWPKGHFEKL